MRATTCITRSATIALGLVVIVACGDFPTGPATEPDGSTVPLRLSAFDAVDGDTVVTTFTYDPASSLVQVIAGAHSLELPAYALCDPEVTDECVALESPVTITARSYTDESGRSRVVFSPQVELVSGSTATLSIYDPGAAGVSSARILFCPIGYNCRSQGSGATVVDAGSGYLWRANVKDLGRHRVYFPTGVALAWEDGGGGDGYEVPW